MGVIVTNSVTNCFRSNNYFLVDFLKRQTDDQLREQYANQQVLSEEIEHIFFRFDDNGNGQLELDEFEAVCNQIDPVLSKDLIWKLQKTMVNPISKTVDMERFKEFFIPVFKSKIEYELFCRKITQRGRELGAENKKIENMTQYIDEIELSNNYKIQQ